MTPSGAGWDGLVRVLPGSKREKDPSFVAKWVILSFLVRLAGLEPAHMASEANALSSELQAQLHVSGA